MAAKHDGKHARMNMWVTHQNLAAAKGGYPGYQFKERKIPTLQKGTAKRAAAQTPAAETVAPREAVVEMATGDAKA